MRVRSSPEAQVDALFVFLPDVMRQRDVELRLDPWVAFPMPFRKPEEWPIARMVGERFSERVPGCEIDAPVLKPSEQVGIVCVEQITKVHIVRISAPLEQK